MGITIHIEADENPLDKRTNFYDDVLGHVIVAVVKGDDDALDIKFDVGVNCHNKVDNDTVEQFIKGVEKKFNEAMAPPDEPKQPRIWTPE